MTHILHISDFHLTGTGTSIWGADVKRNFNYALSRIEKIRDDIDAIFITGDLSNDGSIESYEYIDSAFRKIGIPTYYCPGNHDNLENMDTVFSHGYIASHFIVPIANWKFIILNSVVQDPEESGRNKARGWLSSTSLVQLEDAINSDSKRTAIVLHHPPIEPGGWLNRKLLDNRESFNSIIRKYKQVKLVLFGHTHYYQQTRQYGVLYVSASSVGFAFEKELPKFEIAQGKESFNYVSLDDDKILVSNVLIK